MEVNNIKNLLTNLCIELRWLGIAINQKYDEAQIASYIIKVKELSRILEKLDIDPTKTLNQLSKDTGWTMLKLFNACQNYPKITPSINSVLKNEDKSVVFQDKASFRYFTDINKKDSTYIYIDGKKILLSFLSDYQQNFTEHLKHKINKHLDNLTHGISNAKKYISQELNENNSISREYLNYCNNFFINNKKKLIFNTNNINEDIFLTNLRVSTIWISIIDESNCDFIYDIIFWEQNLTEDENYIIQNIEIDTNVDY